MQNKNLIAINDFCYNHQVDISFIFSLQQTGLIEITTIKETAYIEASQVQQLEKIVCFYYDMDINLEGIESITHLLQLVNSLQGEIIGLRNKLNFYELNE